MGFFSKFTRLGKLKNKEAIADRQFLDALEIIKESAESWLDLLVRAKEDSRDEDVARLESKLNNNSVITTKSWNGTLTIEHTVKAEAYLNQTTKKRLIIE